MWFGPNERVIATTIALGIEPCGIAIGFFIVLTYVREEDSREEARLHIF